MGYECDLEEVEQLTVKVIGELFEQEENEEVEFAYKEFGASSINYVVHFWTDVSKQRDVLFAKHKAIKAIRKAYREHDINIPFPIRTLDFDKNKFRAEPISIVRGEEGQ